MSYGRPELLHAWLAMRSSAVGSKREFYWQERTRGLSSALGVDAVPARDLSADAPPHLSALTHLATTTAEQLRQVGTPFDGYLEVPHEVFALHRRYGPDLSARVEELRSSLLHLLDATTAVLWGLPDARPVTRDQVLTFGVDLDDEEPHDADDDLW